MSKQRVVEIVADWVDLGGPTLMGHLTATPARGKEVFAFEYDKEWLFAASRQQLDPSMALYRGPQYPTKSRENFGVFLDSSPDRWGRVLMRRREAQLARAEGREERRLLESDYLLGVHDGHRMGALRFRIGGRFLNDNAELATPPWTSLRELEHASLELKRRGVEDDPDYGRWLRLLIAPGGSLGGARPKASVRDEHDRLWIAKFPSRSDEDDVGAWERVVHDLAERAGVVVPEAQLRRFGSSKSGAHGHHTFLSRRFDRRENGRRLHFASAMTLTGRVDGQGADDGISYMELADLLMRLGSNTSADLEQLWRPEQAQPFLAPSRSPPQAGPPSRSRTPQACVHALRRRRSTPPRAKRPSTTSLGRRPASTVTITLTCRVSRARSRARHARELEPAQPTLR